MLVVVRLYEVSHYPFGVCERERSLRADALCFDRPVEPLELTIGLWVVWGGPNVTHTGDSDELFEVPGNELRPVVADNPWSSVRESLSRPLNHKFHIPLRHRLPNVPVNDVAAASIEHRHEVVERAAQIQVRDVYVPVVVWP